MKQIKKNHEKYIEQAKKLGYEWPKHKIKWYDDFPPNNPEYLATKVLNSKKIKNKWKKDFKRDHNTEDWDLINSEGITIEVKSTKDKYRYDGNYFTFHTPKQHKQIVMKLFLNDDGKIIDFDIIKKVNGIWKSIIK